jgi:hypothetical protein
VALADWLGWLASAVIVVASFCLAGLRIDQPDYATHFHPPLFAIGYVVGVTASVRSLCRPPAQALTQPS